MKQYGYISFLGATCKVEIVRETTIGEFILWADFPPYMIIRRKEDVELESKPNVEVK